MTVKAKFRCDTIVDTTGSGGYSNRRVKLNAVHGQTGENADYAKATPWGNLEMQIDKDTPAFDAFKPGSLYYLTFEPATNETSHSKSR